MPDYLSCGSCPVDFELADIVSFIEHKRQRCTENVDADLLECSKCSKRFHTPWPLLFHVQVDHQILVVRNLKNINLSLMQDKVVTPITQTEENCQMETDHCDSKCYTNYRNKYTQTTKSNGITCCKPLNQLVCCKKVEPQCFEEPCPCPANGPFLSDICYYSCDNVQKSDSESSITCCICPQPSIKKETREVQTDFDYNDEVDINFLLSQPNNSHDNFTNPIATTFAQQSIPFTTQQYAQNGRYAIPIDKHWEYFSQAESQISDTSNGDYYENSSYQMILNEMRLHSTASVDFLDPNQRLSVDPRTPSPNSQRNLSVVLNNESPVFPFKTNCLKEQSLMNHSTLFQESSNPFPFNMAVEQDNTTINKLLSNHQPLSKEILSHQPLISSNNNRPHNYFQNQPDYSSEFGNNETNDHEKPDGEKKEFRFLCPNCGKRFRQKVHLRKHVMSQHARQKPHKCGQCGYTTVEKSHLTVHIRTHTGERPYTCRRCSYSSAQNCTLKSHYLRRHPGDQIDCGLCGSSYITEQERNNHQRSCRISNGIQPTMTSGVNQSDSNEMPTNNLKTS